MKVIGVRFKTSGRIYYFDPLSFELQEGDGVIVETARGQEYGEVAQVVMDVEESALVSPLKPVIRPATEQDQTMREQNAAKEGDAFHICQRKIEQHGLDMRLVSAEYSFNGSKLVFYFTADERVDFRELVKDLASQFRTRIELRQIGVRDEAKMLGGLGSCGRPVCCKAFLENFHPVSIKMAKEQNLSLSPTKISGLCGRLMCCLQYEQSAYEEMKSKMPRVNREVQTPDGNGIAVENNAITEKTKVRLFLPDGTIEMREYHYSLLAKPGEPLPVPPRVETEEQAEEQPIVTPEKTETITPREDGSSEPEAQKSANKRRRRGGRGRSGHAANTQTDGAPASEAGMNPNERRPQQRQNGARNGGATVPNGKQEAQNGGSAQNGNAPAQGDANGQPNPNRKRRRRGGVRHPRPNGDAPKAD